jgi:apolipoprotein N-acyltransferase
MKTLKLDWSKESIPQGVFHGLLAMGAFQAAFLWPRASCLIAVYLYGLCQLSGLGTPRKAFYGGLITGFGCFAPQLHFFWNIFGPAAAVLWLILAFWIGAFVLLTHLCRYRLGAGWAVLLAPFFWVGLEYFRSELYPLRFTWLSVGYAFAGLPQAEALRILGVYGVGFVLVLGVVGVSVLPAWPRRITGVALLAILHVAILIPSRPDLSPLPLTALLRVAGIQAEFPASLEVPRLLDELVQRHPKAKLLVLSEYTFDGPVPPRVKAWCRQNGRYLIVGGKQYLDATNFLNTVFVISPEGRVVFRQVKCVPIQFFRDGGPALSQNVWDSPWGKIGLCVCYDLGYTRVVDRLVRLGAQVLIVPTMDVLEWGRYQHVLHARITQVRAAELRLPIMRVASSGISQVVAPDGRLMAEAPCPGEWASLSALIALPGQGSLPRDRMLGPVSVGVILVFLVFLGFWMRGRKVAHPFPAGSGRGHLSHVPNASLP